MKKILNSIGRKIFVIILFSLITTSLMVVISLGFFGKIGEVGGIKEAAYTYEVMTNNAVIKFNEYITTNNATSYEELQKVLTKISHTDGRMGMLYRLFEAGHSFEEIVKMYIKKTGDTDNVELSAALIETLMGTEVIKDVIEVTDKAHKLSLEWKQLVDQYAEVTNPEERKIVVEQFKAIENELSNQLKSFHIAMGGVAAYFSAKIRMLFIIIFIIAVVFNGVIGFYITRSITSPLHHTVDYVKTVSSGDFKETLDIESSDELGTMVASINEMSVSLRDMVKEVKNGVELLSTSSGDLTELSDQVSVTAVDNAGKADTVAVAAEEMSANMSVVADKMAEYSQNTNTVVTAVEEMTSTINEITKNTELARTVTDKAVDRSKSATEKMEELGKVAENIGEVTETIADISEQTNLLSLNATIEAARAGEAGKGFAVVANEIKELAQLTASSTRDIKEQIDEIQGSTQVAVEEINEISGVITEINQIVTTIASAIEEQSIVTQEISQNVSSISEGISEVSNNIGQSSTVANDITMSITEVHKSTDVMKLNSTQAKDRTLSLSELSKKLNSMMSQFKI